MPESALPQDVFTQHIFTQHLRSIRGQDNASKRQAVIKFQIGRE
jgi:hypothetical protein